MKYLISILFVLIFSTSCLAQDFWFEGPRHPYQFGRVGYYPQIQWYPQGVNMNVGPVVVSPDRRYVRMGFNIQFSEIQSVYTFNYYTGQYERSR